jgi:rod shape-determining protein MreC
VAKARRSRRTWTTVVVLVLVSLTIVTVDQTSQTHHLTAGAKSVADDVLSPLRSAVDDVLHPVGDLFAGAVHYGALQTENQKLQAEIGQLRQRQDEQPFDEEQLRELLALQNLPFVGDVPTVGAQTTAVDVSNFDADVTIDKGRDDGVAYGMPVVGAGGLVGQVVEADHRSSIVQLIVDGQSKIGVTLGVPAAASPTAVAQGQGQRSPLLAVFVAGSAGLRKGRLVYTDGLEGAAFPGGIPVGRVASWRTVAGGTQLNVSVTPAANLGQLRYLEVLQWEPTP